MGEGDSARVHLFRAVKNFSPRRTERHVPSRKKKDAMGVTDREDEHNPVEKILVESIIYMTYMGSFKVPMRMKWSSR